MAHSFFQKNPIAPEVPTKNNGPTKISETKSSLKPLDDTGAALFDIHRQMTTNKLFIKGTSALELRKQDLLITPGQDILCELDEQKIDDMGKDKIHRIIKQHIKELGNKEQDSKISKKIPAILESRSDIEAQQQFKEYRSILVNKIGFSPSHGHTDINEFKDFLRKHLLREVKDEPIREFLIDQLAKNLNQNSYGEAVNGYFAEKITREATKENKGTGEYVKIVNPSVGKVNLACKDNRVSIEEDFQYKSVTLCKDDNFISLESDKDYFARVKSTLYVSAEEKKYSGGKREFNEKLHGDPLLIDLKKDKNKTAVNFFSKVFDPRCTIEKIIDYLIEKITHRKQRLLNDTDQSPEIKKPSFR